MPSTPSMPLPLAALILLSLASACAPFAHLTDIGETAPQAHGPMASDCGDCHVEHYKEWQQSAHARAYTNPRFQEILTDGVDDSCLGCHVPGTVPTDGNAPAPRNFNLADGVACISCHLKSGMMRGPHSGSALFNPHPIQEEKELFDGSVLCGSCHQEAYADWQMTKTAEPATPLCQECHMPQVTRTATKGTNIFSKALVAFEDARPSRRHTMNINTSSQESGQLALTLRGWNNSASPAVEISLANGLPHAMPAGSYRLRRAVLRLAILDEDDTVLAEGRIELNNSDNPPLRPGETRSFSIPLTWAAPLGSPLRKAHATLILAGTENGPDLLLAEGKFMLGAHP